MMEKWLTVAVGLSILGIAIGSWYCLGMNPVIAILLGICGLTCLSKGLDVSFIE